MIGVVGAGGGGMAVAAQLALAGHSVAVYDERPEALTPIRRTGITSRGAIAGVARPVAVYESIGELSHACDVVFVVIPTHALGSFAAGAAPHLREGQTWVLLPGGTGGGLEVNREWRRVKADFTLVETDSLPLVCRAEGPGEVAVYARKACLGYAVLRGAQGDLAEKLLLLLAPGVERRSHSLEVTFGYISPVVYPPIYLLGVARFEGSSHPEPVYCSVTQSIARFIEELDRERLRTAAAYGCRPQPLLKYLVTRFGIEASDLHRAFVNLAETVYQGVPPPCDLRSRFVKEDVPAGLIPLVELARLAHTPVPAMETLVGMAELVTGVPYWSIGRTLEKMGIDRVDERRALLG